MKKLLMIFAFCVLAGASAFADSAASFPGGEVAMQEYISQNIQYPAPAMANGIEGVVTVEFTVLADGTIGQIKIVRMLDPDLEQEAIRIVKSMPAWTPADKGGAAVASKVTIPVKFTLPEE